MDHTIIFETEVECPPETEALLDRVMATASGLATCSENLGYRELAIWKDGVTL